MKKGKKIMGKIVLLIICVLVVFFAAFIWWLPSFVMTGKRQTLDEALRWQSEHFDTSFYEGLEKTDYIVKGHQGYELHAEFLKNPEASDKYVIITHGYTDNRMGALKYVPMYLDLGFNCIIYDLRGHGLNKPDFTTYGIREAEDLICIINDTIERYIPISFLGLHGESLGSATTITALKYKPEVEFVVADCGFSDIENVLRTGYEKVGVPQVLFDLADLGSKIHYHYSLKDMRPIDSLDDNMIPILFIHGGSDDLIASKNSEDMAGRTKGYSEVKLIPEAGHAVSIFEDPISYKKYVKEFLDDVIMENR